MRSGSTLHTRIAARLGFPRNPDRGPSFRLLATAVCLTVVATGSCGPSSDVEPAHTGASRPEQDARIIPVQVLERKDPEIPAAVAEGLLSPDRTIRVVVRVAVRRDGAPTAARIVSAEPRELPVARAFAEQVAKSLPGWRFAPAVRDGKPMDAEVEVTVAASGTGDGASPQPGSPR